MSKNNMIPFNNNLSQASQPQLPKTIVQVKYRQIDKGHYGFYYDLDEGINVSMEETDDDYHESKCYNTRFDESITKSERIFYLSAAASGFLTGSMDALGITDTFLVACSSQIDQDSWLREAIILAAKICGYRKYNYSEAVKFLYKRIERHLRYSVIAELSRTPNISGLAFSIIGQYTGEVYYLNSAGVHTRRKMPDYYAIGRNDAEKIVYGLLYWMFHMAVEYARTPYKNLFEGIPQELKDIIEILGNLPIMRSIPRTDDEFEQLFSRILRRAFEETSILNEENKKEAFDLLKTVRSHNNKLKDQIKSVLLNECLTRGIYTAITFCRLINREKPASIYDLQTMDLSETLPYNNRIVARMCFISSGVFVFVNVTGALVKALIGKKVDRRFFKASFIAHLNFPGIGRFMFAVAQDCTYLGSDIEILFSNAFKMHSTESSDDLDIDWDEAYQEYKKTVLDPEQNRILCSLANIAIWQDVSRTKKSDEIRKKESWYNSWRHFVIQSYGGSNESYLMDEKEVYRVLFERDQSGKDKTWLYQISFEFSLFDPYRLKFGADDKDLRKLKRAYDYALDQYALKQTIVSKDDIASIRKDYEKNIGIVDGSSLRKKIGMTAVAGTAVVAGGAAFTFAPVIAVTLAGGSFTGLYGAALTNASLAFFGGGSLAAGGFGMAGGSAVIAGGGALLGLAGSGTVASIAEASLMPNEYKLYDLAKTLTYAKDILLNKMNDQKSVEIIQKMIKILIQKTSTDIKTLKEDPTDLNKDLLGNMETYRKYLINTDKELGKIL